jgi:hypothetical protein
VAFVGALLFAFSPGSGAITPSPTAYWIKLGLALPTVPKGGMVVGLDPLAAINPAQPPNLPVTLPVPIPPINLPGPELFGFTAVGALRITGVAPNADATLTLTTAEPSIPPLPSLATIVACPIAGPWSPPPGGVGAINQAPAANCATPSVGRVATDLSTVSFLLPGTFQGSPGEFDIELEPGASGLPVPFLVEFNAPTSSSVRAPSGGPVSASPTTSPGPVVVPPPAFVSSGPFGALAQVLTSPPRSIASSPAAASPPGSAAPTIQLNQNGAIAVASVPDDRPHRITAVALLFVIGGALWWLGGREGAPVRRLGSLAGVPAAVLPDARGVGRFRHPRSARPHKLR